MFNSFSNDVLQVYAMELLISSPECDLTPSEKEALFSELSSSIQTLRDKVTVSNILPFLIFQERSSSFHILRLRKNCEENRMICERFLSDYREIFEAEPRKSRDNHSKTSNRSSCVPNSLFEKS